MSRALVTGCAGFIGSHLTESLLADGWSVLGIDCFNNNYGRQEKLRNLHQATDWDRFEFVPVDLSRGELEDLVAGSDAIFHLAAEPGVRSSWGDRFEAYVRNNIVASQHLLDAAAKWPEKPFVYASSSSIYGQAEKLPTSEGTVPDPISPYGATKLTVEHLCQAYRTNFGLQVVTLRYFSVYGPRQRPDMAFRRFCGAAIEDRPIVVYGDGHQTRDFTYVGDVVSATRAAAAAAADGLAGEVMNVGGGSRTSLRQALAIIEEAAGRELSIDYRPHERGDVRDTGADTSRAATLIGYSPTTKLEDGLRAEFEWSLGSR